MAFAVALDARTGSIYLAGCGHPAGSMRCLLLHQFHAASLGQMPSRSWLPMNAQVKRLGQLSLQWIPASVDKRGDVWVVDSPAFTLYRVTPGTGKVLAIPIGSKVARQAETPMPHMLPDVVAYAKRTWEPRAVVALSHYIAVSIQKPGRLAAVVELFTLSGMQVATDIAVPGPILGRSSSGDLLVAGADKPDPRLLLARVVGERQ